MRDGIADIILTLVLLWSALTIHNLRDQVNKLEQQRDVAFEQKAD